MSPEAQQPVEIPPAGGPPTPPPGRIGAAWIRFTYRTVPTLMSAVRKRWVRLLNPHCDIRIGPGVHLGSGFSVHAPYGGTLIIEAGCQFRRGLKVELGGPTTLVRFGERTLFTDGGLVQITTSLHIGEGSMLGQDVMIADGAHRFRDWTKHFNDQGYDYRPLTFGPGVAVHSKCTVVHDLGERAVVAANSIVTKPAPAFSLVGGVPAKMLDYFGPPEAAPAGWESRAPASQAS